MTASRRALRCTDVSVWFGGVRAVDEVTFEVDAGVIKGLIGPNGAGKTTLLNVLSGFQKPTHGTVDLLGKDITRLNPRNRARTGVVRTFQSGRIFADLTVRDNILSAAVGVGMRRAAAEEWTDEIVDVTGFARRLLGRRASELPFGEERRLSVLRALACKPQFLLLDEPAAGLNESEGDRLVETILAIPTTFGCGVVLVEHDMRVVMRVCSDIHVLDHGMTLAVGRTDDIRTDPAVITAYFGGVAIDPGEDTEASDA